MGPRWQSAAKGIFRGLIVAGIIALVATGYLTFRDRLAHSGFHPVWQADGVRALSGVAGPRGDGLLSIREIREALDDSHVATRRLLWLDWATGPTDSSSTGAYSLPTAGTRRSSSTGIATRGAISATRRMSSR